jgi:hypothetical protein
MLLPPHRCRRPLCSPHVVGRVLEGVAWMAIASSDRRLGGGVAKGALEPDGTAPLRSVWSRRARRDAPLRSLPVESPSPTGQPPPVAGSGVTEPDGTAPLRSLAPPPPPTLLPPTPRLHAVPSRVSPPSSRGVTGGAPVSCVPPISSTVPPNKSSN